MNRNIAVLFDMDGVLVHTNPWHKIAFDKFLEKYNITLSDEELKTQVYGRTNREIMPFVFKEAYTEEKSEQWADEKEALFRELYVDEAKPVDGLIPFLEALKKEGVKTAVGTSAPVANLDFILDKIHIRHYFDALLHSADVKYGKPNPEIYLNAAARLDVDPSVCVVFEDSLPGVEAGLNAGMKVVGITTTHTPDELAGAHLVIDDFNGLTVAQLEALFR